jgi:hypothetical protein
MVSTDQFVSSKGQLTTLKGKELDSQKYTGGTIFNDHASGFIFVVSQVSLGAAETYKQSMPLSVTQKHVE